jgi:hypothetical protein
MVKMAGHAKDKNKRVENDSRLKTKKIYTKPQLSNFGNIEDLTKGGAGSNADKQGTRARK